MGLLRGCVDPCYPVLRMARTNLSASRLLADLRVTLLPLLREVEPGLVKLGDLHHWPEGESLLHVVRKIIPILAAHQSGREKSFWSRVDQRGNHMIWLGEGREGPSGSPVCEWGGKRTTASRVAWLLLTGESLQSGRGGERLRRLCDEPRCISPSCHRKAASLPGRTSGIHMDANGRPTCKEGHPLKRFPKPRETVYCSACYQAKRVRDRIDGPVDLAMTPQNGPQIRYTNPEGTPLVYPVRLEQAELAALDDERNALRPRPAMNPTEQDRIDAELDAFIDGQVAPAPAPTRTLAEELAEMFAQGTPPPPHAG